MKSTFNSSIRCIALLGVCSVAFAPTIALAQSAPDITTSKPAAKDEKSGDIVVTGTSLRKVAPAGAEAITITPTQITATGATSTDDLLATIPQISSFGSLQTANSGGDQLTVNRTNIRNLPQGVGGGSPTLVLMDGHRMVGEGVQQSYPDPDVIPPALIERVEVITDGGSAIYGADAIGGVVNFVTKSNFDGIAVSGRQGIGGSYDSSDANVTVGKAWSTGDVYIGYNYAHHSAVYGYDRSFIQNINPTTGLPNYENCSPGNVVVGGTVYAVGSGNPLQASNANLCDNAKSSAFYPDETRHSVMGGLRQQLGSNLTFDVKAYYSQRNDAQDGGPQAGNATVYGTAVPYSPGYPAYGVPPTPAIAVNPNYIPVAGHPGATETIAFNFAGVPGGDGVTTTHLQAWGITPELTWKMPHDWQMKAYFNAGGSKTYENDPQVNQTLLNADVTAGTINPYSVASSNPAALASVLDYDLYGIGKDNLSNAKITFDGPLLKLPGGDLRVAVGGEWSHEKFQGIIDTDTYANVVAAPLNTASRNVKSGFGELNVPLVGPSNNIPLIYSLTLSGAERYDRYSDFGGNWAPNLGVSLKPISWINLRGRWNRSFQAPSLVNLAQASSPTVSAFPNIYTLFDSALVDPAYANNGGSVVAIQGTVAPLQPERARDYNIGFDVSPPFLAGLNAHFSYWNIKYTGQIGTPPLGYGVFWGVPTFAPYVLTNPTIAQLTTFLQNAGVPAQTVANGVATVQALGGTTYYVADVRSRNLGVDKTHGFDIAFEYSHATSFGSVYSRFNSSLTKLAINAADGVDFGANQAGLNGGDFNSTLVVGAVAGQLRGQVTWNHQAGYTLSSPVGNNGSQTTVGAFNTIDLFMQYEIKDPNFVPITFSLGANNLFNTAPPVYQGSSSSFGSGYANGSPLGRVVQLGASVKF